MEYDPGIVLHRDDDKWKLSAFNDDSVPEDTRGADWHDTLRIPHENLPHQRSLSDTHETGNLFSMEDIVTFAMMNDVRNGINKLAWMKKGISYTNVDPENDDAEFNEAGGFNEVAFPGYWAAAKAHVNTTWANFVGEGFYSAQNPGRPWAQMQSQGRDAYPEIEVSNPMNFMRYAWPVVSGLPTHLKSEVAFYFYSGLEESDDHDNGETVLIGGVFTRTYTFDANGTGLQFREYANIYTSDISNDATRTGDVIGRRDAGNSRAAQANWFADPTNTTGTRGGFSILAEAAIAKYDVTDGLEYVE